MPSGVSTVSPTSPSPCIRKNCPVGRWLCDQAFADPDTTGALAADAYLGAGAPVREDFQQPEVRLNYDPDGDRSFSGFDRFGRLLDQVWEDYSGTPEAIDRFKE